MAKEQVEREEKLHVESVTYNGLTWINIEKPGEGDIDYLSQNYPFHPLDLDDVMSRRQRPKVDSYKDYLFYVLHFPKYRKDEGVLISSQVSIFIGDDYLITIHAGELKPLVKLFRECEINEESRSDYFGSGLGFLMYSIIDRLIDYCVPIINKVMDNIEQVENEIFSSREKGVIKEISTLRRDVISFRRIIWPMRAVIGGLEGRIKKYITKDMSVYFGDLTDHTDKIWDALDEAKEIIEGLSSTYDSLSTNRTNEVVRILTIVATILLPITVVSSVYGMNIEGLPFADSEFSMVVVVLVIVSIIAGMLCFFRRIRVI